jgi:hypothetical protein
VFHGASAQMHCLPKVRPGMDKYHAARSHFCYLHISSNQNGSVCLGWDARDILNVGMKKLRPGAIRCMHVYKFQTIALLLFEILQTMALWYAHLTHEEFRIGCARKVCCSAQGIWPFDVP